MSQTMLQDYINELVETVKKLDLDSIETICQHIQNQVSDGKRIFVAGNGGSGAIASHLANDWSKGLYAKGLSSAQIFCLNDNTPTFTAIANDIGYESTLSIQLEMFAKAGDTVILISGSGNSSNILKAADFAIKNKIHVVGVTGFGGGALIELSDYRFHAPINNMQISEDIMSMFGHLIYAKLTGMEFK